MTLAPSHVGFDGFDRTPAGPQPTPLGWWQSIHMRCPLQSIHFTHPNSNWQNNTPDAYLTCIRDAHIMMISCQKQQSFSTIRVTTTRLL